MGRPPRVREDALRRYVNEDLTGRPPRERDSAMRHCPSQATGRPPRVGGGRCRRRRVRVRAGKTPACAGRTAHPQRCGSWIAEDPRVCGEDKTALASLSTSGGRPPRERGGRWAAGMMRMAGRKTPACAGRTSSRSYANLDMEEDPRVCGEDEHMLELRPDGTGRPPRVRGGRHGRSGGGDGGGKTPACAGRTTRQCRSVGRTWEDPRVCGEDCTDVSCSARSAGRPPRVRGGRPCTSSPRPPHRKTPACAGRTTLRSARSRSNWEDPRVCGEDEIRLRPSSARMGRPPRVRGGLTADGAAFMGDRKTPACAGRTTSFGQLLDARQEDPRVCGEDSSPRVLVCAHVGRPPRVRGGRHVAQHRRPRHGKTPACAGRTAPVSASQRANSEDPRVCGEDRRTDSYESAASGRPPRVRGGRAPGDQAARAAGKTPACAGRTGSARTPATPLAEDPRVCGEDQREPDQIVVGEGRPPRVRGGLSGQRPPLGLSRKTPACAGRTWLTVRRSTCRREDPRVCGEDGLCFGMSGGELGRPPRVRGGPIDRAFGRRG